MPASSPAAGCACLPGRGAASGSPPGAPHATARARLRLLRRAVDCFGCHLARLDIRQNSAVHERTIAELMDAAIPGMSYLALSEEARVNLLLNELRSARPLSSALGQHSAATPGGAAGSP